MLRFGFRRASVCSLAGAQSGAVGDPLLIHFTSLRKGGGLALLQTLRLEWHVRVDYLQRIFAALNQAEVRYLVVGGIAVIAHVYQRLTADVDLVIGLDNNNSRNAMTVLTALGYQPVAPVAAGDFADPAIRNSWIKDKGMRVFQMRCDEFRWEPLDIFVSEPFAFDEVHGRAHWHDLGGGLRLPVVPLAELLDLKRSAARPQDLLDVQQLTDYRKFSHEHE